jgi:hypothetical protein
MSRRRAALGVAVLSLLVLAAIRGGGGGPPLYDGLCAPPHYLFLGGNPPPSRASAEYTAAQLAQTEELATSDAIPQAQVIIAAGSLAPVPPATTVTVSLTPVPPPSTKPSDGGIQGNVYEFAARSGGHSVPLAPGHPATVVLAAPSASGPQLVVERNDGRSWTSLKTFQSGCGDTDEAATTSLGLFALVALGTTSPGAGNPGAGGAGGIVLIIAGVVVVLAVLIGAVRLSRRRS